MLRRVWRFAVWLTGGLLLVLILALLGAGLYTRTDHFHRLLREQILAALQGAIDGEVALDNVEGSVWEEFRLQGLSIRQQGVEVVSVAQGAVTLNLLSQLVSFFRTATFHITHVTLTEPVIRLVQEPEKGWNVTHLLKPAEQPQEQAPQPLALSLLFPQLTVKNGRIAVRLADGREFSGTAITVDGDAALLPAHLQVNINNLSLALAGTGIPALQWSSSLAYEDANGLSRVLLRSVDLHTAHSHLQLSGSIDNLATPMLALQAGIEKLAAADVRLFLPEPQLQQDVSGTVHIAGPLAALQVNAALAVPSGQVSTAVTADLTQTPPDAQGTLELKQFAVDKVFHLPDVAGEVTGKVAFHGTTLETLHADLSVYVARLLASGRQLGEVNLTGNLANRKAKVIVEVKGTAGYVYSQSQLTLGDRLAYELTLMIRNLDTRQVDNEKAVPPANVSLDAWVKGSGTKLEDIDSAIKLTVLPSRLQTLTLTQAEVVGTLRKGVLTLDKATLLANDTTVNAQGQIGGLQRLPNSKLSYSVQTKNIAPWLALAGQSGTGALTLSGTANGALTALNVEGKLLLEDFGVGKNTLQRGTVTYKLADVGSPQTRGRLTAALTGVQAGLRLRSVNTEVVFSGLKPTEVQAEITVQDEASRTHRAKTQTHYEPERVEVLIQELALQLPSGTWRTPQAPRLLLRDEVLAIENFSLQRADQTIGISGTFAQQGPLNLQAQVSRFSLEELRPFLGDSPDMSGRVNATVRVQGTVASPEVTADITTGALQVAGQSYAGLSTQSTYRNERLDLHLLFRQDDVHTLSVEGGMPLALNGADGTPGPRFGEANLRVRSEGLSLAFLNVLSKQIQEVQGAVSMDVNLRGTIPALAASGPVQLRQGHVRVKQLGLVFSDINVEVQLAPEAVRLSRLTVHSGDGQLAGNGTVTLRRYMVENIDLTLDADRFRVSDTREYRAAISGQLRCSGALQNPLVKGTLEVVDTTLRPDLAVLKSGPAAPDETITVVQHAQELAQPSISAQEEKEKEETRPGPPIPQEGFYQKLALDIAVAIPHDTWVHMREGSIELMGNLRVKKDPEEELALSGNIETVRGWIAYQGRKFRVEKGTVVFTGATPIDPSLDLVARYTLPDYIVDVTVGGTAKSPTVNFSSQPSLEQADILSLLMFGKPANSLSQGQKTTLQSQAVQALTGAMASELGQALSESLGLDNLELDVGQNPHQSKVGAGKYVSPGVFVSTSQQLGGNGQGGQDVSIEYQLSDDWQLKASTTSKGNNGLDILWKKKY